MKKILCFLLLLAIAFSLTACAAQNQPYSNPTIYQDLDKNYFISFGNGKYQSLGDANYAAISPNRKQLIAAISSGESNPRISLYLRNPWTKKWDQIEERKGEMHGLACTDKIAFAGIENNDKEYICVYDISKKQLIIETEMDNIMISSYLDEIVFAYPDNGNLFVLKSGKTKPEMIYDYGKKEIEISFVSADGKTVIWTEEDEKESRVMLYQKGSVTSIGSYDDNESKFETATGDKKGYWNIISYSDKTDILYKGKTIKTLSGGNLTSASYTDNGILENEGKNASGIYLILDNDLYYCNKKGERTRLLTDVENFRITNGRILYCKDETLYMAKINRGKIKDPTRLKSDFRSYELYRVQTSENGKYVYYIVDDILYAFREGENGSKRVANDVSNFGISADGKNAFFLSEREIAENSVSTYTLQRYRYGKDTTTISFDAMRIDYSSKYIDPNSLDYREYIRQKDGTVYFDLMHYNGRKSKTVLQDLIQK